MMDIPDEVLRGTAMRSVTGLVAGAKPHEQAVLLELVVDVAFGLLMAIRPTEGFQIASRLFAATEARLAVPYAHPRPHWQAVVAEVALQHGLTPGDLLGPRRDRRAADARHEAYAALRGIRRGDGRPAWSTLAIGRIFKRDHSTVVVGLQRHAEQGRADKGRAA